MANLALGIAVSEVKSRHLADRLPWPELPPALEMTTSGRARPGERDLPFFAALAAEPDLSGW